MWSNGHGAGRCLAVRAELLRIAVIGRGVSATGEYFPDTRFLERSRNNAAPIPVWENTGFGSDLSRTLV